ncbi:hypothetical protein [Hydrogenophaga sp.]|jgi:hypothetical protein|uniref:hypothetical protein n=1 Tax=Hydrogenophaga sp. TaxID=1904254 RepID=UPI003F6F6EC8
MKAMTFNTAWSRSSGWARGLTIATLAAGAWALSGIATQAEARGNDVYFSVGVNTPGIAVGVSNAPPVYYAPRPIYHAPRPIYYAPPPVYYVPPPAYYAPRPIYRSHWGHGPRWDDRRDWHRDRGHRGHRHGHR